MELHPFFAKQRIDGRASIVLKAAWADEQARYRATLELLLRRLKSLGGVIVDASVESRETRALRKADRRLKLRDRSLPLSLRDERDLRGLRIAIQAAEAAVKVTPGTSGGNPTRRLELIVDGADRRWPRVGLHERLVKGHRFVVGPPGGASAKLVLATTTPYRRQAALPRGRERRKFETNPDLQERGVAAHAAAQNAIADSLARQGIAPLAARDGAAFDVAFAWNGTFHVMEVKSLTKGNEERQLRLGLGQVLRYRDLAAAEGLRSRAWLIAEREPSDVGWQRLCSSVDVLLSWPADFDRVLAQQLDATAAA